MRALFEAVDGASPRVCVVAVFLVFMTAYAVDRFAAWYARRSWR